MAKTFISDRIIFNRKGVQREFILNSKQILGLTWIEFSKKMNHPRAHARGIRSVKERSSLTRIDFALVFNIAFDGLGGDANS